jgi:hypothetical protein
VFIGVKATSTGRLFHARQAGALRKRSSKSPWFPRSCVGHVRRNWPYRNQEFHR